MITKEKKRQILENLKEVFPKANLLVFVNFFGLNVATFRELRKRINAEFGKDAKLAVVKNSLASIALAAAEYDEAQYEKFLKGPTAVFYLLNGDPVNALKLLVNFAKERSSRTSSKVVFSSAILSAANRRRSWPICPPRKSYTQWLLADCKVQFTVRCSL